MGFLDKLLGRGRQAMGQVAAGGSLNPEQVVQQEAEAAKRHAESAPENAKAKAERDAQNRVEGTDR